MVTFGDEMLRLGPEGFAGERHEEFRDFILASVGAAYGAVAWFDPVDVVSHVVHGTYEVSGAEGLIGGLGRGLFFGCGHCHFPPGLLWWVALPKPRPRLPVKVQILRSDLLQPGKRLIPRHAACPIDNPRHRRTSPIPAAEMCLREGCAPGSRVGYP